MRTWVVVALAGAAVLGVITIVALWWFVRNPLEAFAWFGRRALNSAGLERMTVQTEVGPQVVWRGGHGPALLLLHGAGDQAATWSLVAERLARTNTLVVPDLAGHGASAPGTGPISIGAILTGVEGVLASDAGAPKLTVVGNSLGAWIGMLLAVRHPDRIERVVAVNGGAIRGHGAASLQPRTRAEAAALVAMLRDPASAPVPGFVLDDIVRQAQTGPLARLAATADTMDEWVLDGRLGELAMPVEIIWGESDRVMPLEYAQRMLAALPRAHLTVIPKCGHVPQVECPARFLAALATAVPGLVPPVPATGTKAASRR